MMLRRGRKPVLLGDDDSVALTLPEDDMSAIAIAG